MPLHEYDLFPRTVPTICLIVHCRVSRYVVMSCVWFVREKEGRIPDASKHHSFLCLVRVKGNTTVKHPIHVRFPTFRVQESRVCSEGRRLYALPAHIR